MEKPTYMSSTFSILTIIVTVGFVVLCVMKQDLVALERLVGMLVGGYGVKKGMEMAGTGKNPNEDKKT